MNSQDLLDKIADIMEIDGILYNQSKLTDFEEWDSLTKLGIISLFDVQFGVKLSAEQISNITYVEDLVKLAQAKLQD